MAVSRAALSVDLFQYLLEPFADGLVALPASGVRNSNVQTTTPTGTLSGTRRAWV